MKAAWEDDVRESGGNPKTKPILVEHWAMAENEAEAREGAEKWRFITKAWTHGTLITSAQMTLKCVLKGKLH